MIHSYGFLLNVLSSFIIIKETNQNKWKWIDLLIKTSETDENIEKNNKNKWHLKKQSKKTKKTKKNNGFKKSLPLP